MIAAIDAERIKLVSTRSPYWCVVAVVVLGVGIAALIGALVGEAAADPTDADGAAVNLFLIGVNQVGVAILTVMAVLGITNEYRFGTIRPTFAAVPRRGWVLGAKAAVYAAVAFATVAIVTVVSVVLAQALSGTGVDLASANAIRQLWGTPVYAALCVVIGLSIGAVLRQTAGAVAIVLVWMLAVENIVGALPQIGEHVNPFLPFKNGLAFLSGNADSFHWNAYGALAYFAVFAALVFAAAVAVTDARDT